MVEENSFRMGDGNFSPYGLGPSFLAIPFYAAGKLVSFFVHGLTPLEITRGSCSFFNSFVTAITCVILFNLLRAFSISIRACFLTTFLYGVGTLAWPYSKYFFPQPLAGLCLLGAIMGLFQFSLKQDRIWLYRAGFWGGLLIFTRFEGILFFLLGAGYLFTKKGKRLSDLISFSIFPCIFLIFSLLYNYIRSGEYLNPGYGNSLADFSTPILLGLYGNLFSSGKGLFIYMPVILLSIIGLRFFRYRREAVLISLTFLIYLLFYSKWWDWSGDWAWGPRLMVMLIPIFFIPIGFLLDRIRIKSIAGVLIFSLGLLSILLQVIALPISFNEYLRDVYRQPEVKLGSIKLRPHHFLPELSPLKAQVLLIKERIKILKEGMEVAGYDYYGRKIHMPVFDFWYINLLRKAPSLRKAIFGFLILVSLGWILTLCLVVNMIKYKKKENRYAIKTRPA